MALPNLSSPPTNAWGLYQYLAQRLPGYDPSEYLRELNSAYIHVWEEIVKLRNYYFSTTKTGTVLAVGSSFDLQFGGSTNTPGNGSLSFFDPRMYQIIRVRVQPPQGGLFQTTTMISPNDPDFLSVAANPSSTPTQTGPYYCYQFGRNILQFALPLQIGTTLEVTYTFWPLALNFLFNGTVTTDGADTGVLGVGTTFTQLVQPDFEPNLVTTLGSDPTSVQAELVINTNQVYRVAQVTDDLDLSTAIPVPALAGTPYVLATLPEIPREHIRVIASIAMAKMYSVDGDDARTAEWTAIAASNMQMMKDSLIERQGQNPPRKGRFQYGIGRRNRAFLR